MNGRIWSGFRSSESQRVKGDFVPGKAANDPHIDQAVISGLIRTRLLRSSLNPLGHLPQGPSDGSPQRPTVFSSPLRRQVLQTDIVVRVLSEFRGQCSKLTRQAA
jgi:hypothetical protein